MVNVISGKVLAKIPSQAEQTMVVSLFAREPLSRIPLIDLQNTLRIYGVSFSRCTEQTDPEMPALALFALQEIRRRLCCNMVSTESVQGTCGMHDLWQNHTAYFFLKIKAACSDKAR